MRVLEGSDTEGWKHALGGTRKTGPLGMARGCSHCQEPGPREVILERTVAIARLEVGLPLGKDTLELYDWGWVVGENQGDQ